MSSSGDAPAQGQAAPSNDTSLHSIIASYLKKKGYNRSIEGLAADLGVSVDKIAVSIDLLNDATVLQSINTYNGSEKFPGSFEQSFKALGTWIDRSLDQCKVCEVQMSHLIAKTLFSLIFTVLLVMFADSLTCFNTPIHCLLMIAFFFLQPELSSVLFPLFVHGYLDLVKKGQQLYGA
jgi:hypothetical protein